MWCKDHVYILSWLLKDFFPRDNSCVLIQPNIIHSSNTRRWYNIWLPAYSTRRQSCWSRTKIVLFWMAEVVLPKSLLLFLPLRILGFGTWSWLLPTSLFSFIRGHLKRNKQRDLKVRTISNFECGKLICKINCPCYKRIDQAT